MPRVIYENSCRNKLGKEPAVNQVDATPAPGTLYAVAMSLKERVTTELPMGYKRNKKGRNP
jgi:hypothetical protein